MSQNIIPIPSDISRELVRQGEVRLGAIMTLAIGADSRATTLCGIFGAASIALAAAVLAYLGIEHHVMKLVVAGALTAALLLFASVLAAFATSPRDFWVAGGMPRDLRSWAWDQDTNRWRSETEMLDATAQRLSIAIERDWQLLEVESRRVRYSLRIGLAAVICGILIAAAPLA